MKNFRIITAVLSLVFMFQAVLEAKNITLREGSSLVLEIAGVQKIEYEDEEIASARIISEKDVLISAKKAGTAAINFFTAQGTVNVAVEVKSTITGRKMIELDVQILEIAETSGFSVGVDWNALLGRSSKTDENPFVSPLNVKENMLKDEAGLFDTGLFYMRKLTRGQINIIVDFLVSGNHAKILAKPKLLAASGKGAKFLSGGEIPVPMTDSDGKITVDWKTYGVKLDMTPTLSSDNAYITADMRVEVSNVDYSNAVNVGSGGSIPAMRTRWAETSIDVAENETIVIAGLLNTEKSKVTSEVPVLGWIPLLGELFKNTTEKEVKTELVIFVTPQLVTK